MKAYWISIIISLALAGCGSSQTDGVHSPPNSTAEPFPNILPTMTTQGDKPQMDSTTTPAPGMEALIEKAKDDLAQRLSISMGDINLVEAKEVTWSDGSLGCPQPDMLYAQVLTPGYLIKLRYGTRDFEYHAGKGGALMYCENPLPPFQDNT